MPKIHHYNVTLEWTGNRGEGTADYRAYERDHELGGGSKPRILGSSDPAFRGDPQRWNPEDLLVASLAACHQLWFLHLCSVAGIIVSNYRDDAEGMMEEAAGGGGRFTRVVLRPVAEIRPQDDEVLATRLHHEAHAKCFIANSVNFPVDCEPTFTRSSAETARMSDEAPPARHAMQVP